MLQPTVAYNPLTGQYQWTTRDGVSGEEPTFAMAWFFAIEPEAMSKAFLNMPGARPDVIEDIAQHIREDLLKQVERIDPERSEGEIRSWLRWRMGWRAMDARDRMRRDEAKSLEGLLDTQWEPEDRSLDLELRMDLEAFLHSLQPNLQQLLQLLAGGYSQEEASKRLGVSPRQVTRFLSERIRPAARAAGLLR